MISVLLIFRTLDVHTPHGSFIQFDPHLPGFCSVPGSFTVSPPQSPGISMTFLIGSPYPLEISGAIHSTKISGNFGLKLNGSVRSNRKSFEKIGPPFEVDHFSRLDRSDRNGPFHLTILNPSISLFGIFHEQHGAKLIIAAFMDS